MKSYRFINQSRLSRKSNVGWVYISGLTPVLVDKGVLTIERIDNRENRLYLTEYGKEYLEELKLLREKYMSTLATLDVKRS